jgi:hypothetical protein
VPGNQGEAVTGRYGIRDVRVDLPQAVQQAAQ